ncbi:hypothetical protein [Yoonia sp. SS1-5]|uniref:Uncharacterized protein n=1 Tax=Yoonia rhodophyticola TaxID=3137370 RepID=A0AAN0M8G2_9RHOB
MRMIARVAFWVLLGVPSLVLLLTLGAEQVLTCQMDPYQGFTCPRIFGYAMPLAALGIFTIIPFLIIGFIWLGMSSAAALAGRRRR